MSALNTKCDCCGDYRPTSVQRGKYGNFRRKGQLMSVTRNLRPLRNARQTEGGFSDRPAAEADNTRLIVLGLVGLGLFFMMVAVWADLLRKPLVQATTEISEQATRSPGR